MKISTQLMKYCSGDQQWNLNAKELSAKIGAQLGAVEETLDTTGKYDGVFVAQIIGAKDHPQADKLGIYQIDTGSGRTVQVLAGDRTLNIGDKVGWISPGATVPVTWNGKEPFVISERTMRGEISNGMFGSGKELDINDDHERVQVLDTDAPAGTPFAAAYGIEGDIVIDIENKMFTHRPDCFGNLGIAREIAGIQNLPFESPDWYSLDAPLPVAEHVTLPLKVTNEIPDVVPRYMAVAFDDVKIAPSPLWLQMELRKLGVRPINNVVDITNYIMLLTGQPLHAFDYNKVADAHIVVRHPQKDEQLPLLDGRIIQPPQQAMLICDTKKPIGLGGMMGGGNSEIDKNTTRIVLECANFDMYTIRRTSMLCGVFSDAVTRYSKGQSPWQCAPVLAKAAKMLSEICGCRVASDVVGHFNKPKNTAPINTTADYINSRLGTNYTAQEIATSLQNVEINVEQHGDQLIIAPPFWRMDLEIPEDVIEEVGRLKGYDTLPSALPFTETKAAPQSAMELLKKDVRDLLAQAGANELQTYSFVPEKLLQQANQEPKKAFALRNALSPELQRYRLSLTPSLLDKVHSNIKARFNNFCLFEINKVHINHKEAIQSHDGLPKEYQMLGFVYSNATKQAGASYYRAKYYLDYLFNYFGVNYNIVDSANAPDAQIYKQICAPFEPKRTGYIYSQKGDFIGCVGEYRVSTKKSLKLPEDSAGFEIDLEQLLINKQSPKYNQILKYPALDQDVCFKLAAGINYVDLYNFVSSSISKDARLRVKVLPRDIYRRPEQTDFKQITLRIILQHADKTLSTNDATDIIDAVADKVAARFNAERI